MAPERPDDPVTRLWREQHTNGGTTPISAIRARSSKVHRRFVALNVVEYGAAAWVLVMSVRGALALENPLVRIGFSLIAAAAVFIACYMYRYGVSLRTPHAGEMAAIDFYRAELTRQRDLLQSVWRWYLLPLAPGLGFVLAGRLHARPDEALAVAATAVGAVLAAVMLGRFNARAAQRLQRDLDAL